MTEINEEKGRRQKKKYTISNISSKTETDFQNEVWFHNFPPSENLKENIEKVFRKILFSILN